MTPEEIKKAVELYYSIDDIGISLRRVDYVNARVVYFVLARRNTSASLATIAGLVNRDHSTAHHNLKIYNDVWMSNQIMFERQIEDILILDEQFNLSGTNALVERPELFALVRKQELFFRREISELRRKISTLERDKKELIATIGVKDAQIKVFERNQRFAGLGINRSNYI